MPKKKRPSTQPGGPGAMGALERARAKLKALGIKLYKHVPESAKPKKGAPEPEALDEPAGSPAPRRRSSGQPEKDGTGTSVKSTKPPTKPVKGARSRPDAVGAKQAATKPAAKKRR